MSRPGIEPGPPTSLEESHLDSLLIAVRNIYELATVALFSLSGHRHGDAGVSAAAPDEFLHPLLAQGLLQPAQKDQDLKNRDFGRFSPAKACTVPW